MRSAIQIGFILVLVLLTVPSAMARGAATKNLPRVGSEQPWCQANAWPLNRDMPIPKVVGQFEQFPGAQRIYILQWGWGEILKAHPKHMVAPIFTYLAGTEQDRNMRGYYESMAYIAMDEVDLKSAMKIWPKRVPLAQTRMSLKEMCDFYQRTLEMKRQPQSAPAKRAKTNVKNSSRQPSK